MGVLTRRQMASRKFIGNFVAIDEIHETEEKLAKTGELCCEAAEPDWKEHLPVSVGISPKMPETSSGQIGLRSTKPDCLLDIYQNDGTNFKKSDILKRFKWLREGQTI